MIPKFRVFVKSGTKQMYGGVYEEDAMVPVGVLDITGEEVTVWGCGRENCGMCDDYFRMEDIILMQSTGLEDKNGVEIYESDIVVNHVGDVWIITYFRGVFRYYPVESFSKEKEKWFETDNIGNFGTEAFEVIGNVHENPELLEVAE